LTQEVASTHISTLTPAEFLLQVESAQPSVAVFDCDGTLWGGDAGVGFMRWSMESGLLSREACDWIDTRYRGYLHGEVSELAICGEMVQIYRDLRESEMRSAVHPFFEKVIRPHIFPEMAEICHRLHDKGVILWAVSSTNNWLIEDAVKEFGIPAERVLATRVRVTNGLVTDELLDVPTDEGKVKSLVAHGIEHPDAVFGNSIHDAAMLAIASHPFAVNPTVALAELATAKSWPIFQPRHTHA
jgi:phosphoserine phosphatase